MRITPLQARALGWVQYEPCSNWFASLFDETIGRETLRAAPISGPDGGFDTEEVCDVDMRALEADEHLTIMELIACESMDL